MEDFFEILFAIANPAIDVVDPKYVQNVIALGIGLIFLVIVKRGADRITPYNNPLPLGSPTATKFLLWLFSIVIFLALVGNLQSSEDGLSLGILYIATLRLAEGGLVGFSGKRIISKVGCVGFGVFVLLAYLVLIFLFVMNWDSPLQEIIRAAYAFVVLIWSLYGWRQLSKTLFYSTSWLATVGVLYLMLSASIISSPDYGMSGLIAAAAFPVGITLGMSPLTPDVS